MNPASSLDSSSFFRRAIFAAVLVGVFLFYTVFSFSGLTERSGIDQAQIAREVARGNGMTTQFVRPVSISQMIESGKEVNLEHMPESFHSPLNILVYAGVLKMIGADAADSYEMHENDKFFKLDQVIAITCAVFFIIAIGINYLLVSRVFDHKIASVVAIIMMLSDYMWQLTLAGLPQMLMLCIFSTACYTMWRAIERQEAEQSPLVPVLLSGFFFGLLTLAHWMALWIFIGYFIFAVFYFKPRGIVALALFSIISLFVAGPLVFNYMQTGDALGTAYHTIHKSDTAFRQVGTPQLNVKGILSLTLQSSLQQISSIHNYLGGLILAPAFFIALAHQFKRSSIATFRWVILLMWIFATFGMALYGLSEEATDPRQMHILFAPLMSAYGIAMISIIWSRCKLANTTGIASNLHLVIIVLMVATPMVLFIRDFTNRPSGKVSVNGVHAINLNLGLKKVSDKRDIIISDQPWAVAWYADRHAIWMPPSIDQLENIEKVTASINPIAGLHFSSQSYRETDIRRTWRQNSDLTPIVYSQWIMLMTRNNEPYKGHERISALIDHKTGRYKHKTQLTNFYEPSVYYSRGIVNSSTE